MGTVLLSVLSGHQQGADIGYNPQKPGRPSHVYHSYLVANLRISLGVEVRPCNEHSAAKGLPGLWQTLEKLPRHQWPTYEQAFPTQVIPKHYPGPCRRRKLLRRAQKPMGLERLHLTSARLQSAHGQPRRPDLQLVEPLPALLR